MTLSLRTIRTAGIALLALLALPVSAQNGQYYLVAYQAPAGSITSGGQGQAVVYLRWDVLEGALPPDVARLRLTRDGEVLLDKAVTEVMPAADIAQLYSGPAQERRLLETILSLKENAVADGGDFVTSDYPAVIRGLIDPLGPDYDAGWSFLASRNDINVARARYRAWVDTPTAGSHDYELLAVDTVGGTARLGFVRVDTTQPQQLLGVDAFAQILSSQCDLPEMARDHYTVALNWRAPGMASVSDRVAAQVYVTGYDLYRTVDNLDATVLNPPPRDIAAEAAASNHDHRGVPVLAGLEKVNDTLLTVTADLSMAAEWLETRADLERAGLAPGDRRAYYIVPRDFTGNYGPTTATIVVVPNLVRPPAPWELRPIARDGNPFVDSINLTFSFDAVNIDNYLDAYGANRRFCNLFDARDTGVLEFVGAGEDCDSAPHRAVRLDVSDYVIYRFLDFETASRFKDSDGDGVGDFDERAGATQCDDGAQPAGAIDYRLPDNDANLTSVTLPASGKQTWRFEDPAPPSVAGDVFWYRVASKTPDGRLSLLSAPQRGMFPDRRLPPKPTVEARRPGEVRDGCELAVDGDRGNWIFRDEVDDAPFGVSCAGLKETLIVSGKSVGTDGPLCQTISNACAGSPVTLTYPDSANPGADLCTINLPQDLPPDGQGLEFCGTGQARLVPTYAEGQIPVEPGETITGPLVLTVTADTGFPDVCLDLYENIDGDSTRVDTSCGTGNLGLIEYEAPGGYFCGYAVARDPNNNVSPAATVPCTSILADGGKLPTTPQPISLALVGDRADLSWRLPVEPVAVTLVGLEHITGDGPRTRELFSVPSAGSGSGDVVQYTASIAPLAGESDEYCVRFKSVGPDTANQSANSSGWSAPLCETRRAQSSVLPQYLPWPIVDSAVEGTPLSAEFFGFAFIGGNFGILIVDVAPVPDIDIKAYNNSCGLSGTANGPPNTDLFATEIWCNRAGELNARSVIDGVAPFLVYRQGRSPGGQAGDWIQVSPLIEYAHWDSIPVVPGTDFDAELNDPYIKLVANPTATSGWRFVFRDLYTYLPGWDYRYQFVYFDDDHRITRWRRSDWITYGSFQ